VLLTGRGVARSQSRAPLSFDNKAEAYEAESQPEGLPTQLVTLLQPLAKELPILVFLIATQKTKATRTTIKVYSTKP
jgi:hypothetical protein